MLLRTADTEVTPTGREPLAATAAAPRAWWRDVASWAVLLTLVLWAVPFTHASGGRGRLTLTWALLLLVPAILAVRPWRFLRPAHLIALAPAGAGLVACVIAPTGFDGASEVAGLAYAGLLFLLVVGYLNGGGLVGVVVAAVLVAGLDQFGQSWWAWFGGQSSAKLMVGTFFWHNQFATFMAAIGLLAGALVARSAGALRGWGAVMVVVTVPSLMFAASRASLLLFVAGWVALLLVTARAPRRLVPLVVLPLLGVLVALVLSSSLFMADSQTVGTNVEQRQSVTGNGSARLAYVDAAVQVVRDAPLTGSGFDSFATASGAYLRDDLRVTAYVHNGFLQAFVDGGVLLGVAVAGAALLPIGVGVRRCWRGGLGRRTDEVDAATLGALLAAGLLVLHSAVDFDWVYPSLFVLLAVCAALVVRDPEPGERPHAQVPSGGGLLIGRSSAARRVAALTSVAALSVALVLAMPLSVRGVVADAPGSELPAWAVAATLGLPVTEPPSWARGAGECETRIDAALENPALDRAEVEADLSCTAAAGERSPTLQMSRARAMVRLGDVAAGRALADQVVTESADTTPLVLVTGALLTAETGDRAGAVRELRAAEIDPRVVMDPQLVVLVRGVLAGVLAGAQR